MRLPQYVITLGARSEMRTDKNRKGLFSREDFKTIEKVVNQESKICGFTIIRGRGYYEGVSESSVQIIVLSKDRKAVRACAMRLLGTFRQFEVLLSRTGFGEFLSGKDLKKQKAQTAMPAA